MDTTSFSHHYDLITPDGKIIALDPKTNTAVISIESISPAFIGYEIGTDSLFFNLKSTLAQLGVNAETSTIVLHPESYSAQVHITLSALGPLAQEMLRHLSIGAFLGKLFAKDERRLVKNPDYLLRMLERFDAHRNPLLLLGGKRRREDFFIDKKGGRTVAYLPLLNGIMEYDLAVYGFLPTLAKALHDPTISTRSLLQLNQRWKQGAASLVPYDNILLVRTEPLHVRTVFGHVVSELLADGVQHTSASILEPNTQASGDIYELFGTAQTEVNAIPLEFYTLESHREYVFFADRDQLLHVLEDQRALFQAFKTAPLPEEAPAAIFVCKGEDLLNLKPTDWNCTRGAVCDLSGLIHLENQSAWVHGFIKEQPSYPFLQAMIREHITSEGVLFMRHFPSPLMKMLFLTESVQRCLKAIYFQYPSRTKGDFFSHEDRSFLMDLTKFSISVYWVDLSSKQLLKYVPKPEKDIGMFVPPNREQTFLAATFFGVYGSTLVEPHLDRELKALLQGLEKMRQSIDHPLFNKSTPIVLVTGGGPGVMAMGNQVARELNILSCGNVVDFESSPNKAALMQKANEYLDGKMTYRLDRLLERQAEFNLDFPIFLMGGVGTDFEHVLEEVRRKIGSQSPTPVLLFGEPQYWRKKITSRFQCNQESGTIKGYEWLSNCFYCVQNAKEGLAVYERFFNHTLPIGQEGPVYPEGFSIL